MSAPALREHTDRSFGFPTKLVDSVFAATAVGIAWWQLLSYSSLFGETASRMSYALLDRFPFWAVGPVAGVAYAAYWQWREKRGEFPTARRHAQAMAIVRYVVAWIIAGYGFNKVVGIQFYLGLNWQDRPVSELNGFMLTWYYFYRSRALVLIIAALEILGSALLLVPRTTLLGAAVLMPVMVNVTLTDYLYGILGPAPAALFLTASLVYLVSPHRERIARLLFPPTPEPRVTTRSAPIAALRVAVLLLAFFSAAVWVTPINKEKPDMLLSGKWKVNRQSVNGRLLPVDGWKEDTTRAVWSNLYLEDGYFTVSSNPYVFDPAHAKWGNYTYDAGRRSMAVTFPDSVTGRLIVDTLTGDRMALHGLLNRDTVALSLTRVKPLKWYRVYWDWRSPSSAVASKP
jgi:hypothetical protein